MINTKPTSKLFVSLSLPLQPPFDLVLLVVNNLRKSPVYKDTYQCFGSCQFQTGSGSGSPLKNKNGPGPIKTLWTNFVKLCGSGSDLKLTGSGSFFFKTRIQIRSETYRIQNINLLFDIHLSL